MMNDFENNVIVHNKIVVFFILINLNVKISIITLIVKIIS